MMKKVKIGFDLDGVIADGPPLVPKSFLEHCFRGNCRRELVYRFPDNRVEQLIRRISHHYLFRPALKGNLASLKEIARRSGCEVYLISARYDFLKAATEKWLKKNGLTNIFRKVFINTNNQPPHIFKKETLKALDLDVYFEDDPAIVSFLKKETPRVRVYQVNGKNFNFSHLL